MTASSTPAVLAELGDRELVVALRQGTARAGDELWRRHSSAARSYAWTFRELADPDDLVSEAFTRVYTKIRDGGGPDAGFRPYLLSTVRNAAVSWGRARAKEVDHDDFDVVIGGESAEHDAFKKLEGSVTLKAFRSLPSRWQEALWYSEVEGLPREEVGKLLGLNANAVSQLTFRAREGLKTAWVAQHLRSDDLPAECAIVFESIAGYARNTISRRERRKVDAHIPTCARCMILVEEADDVSSRLAFVLIPAFLGIGATTYLSLTPDGMAVAAVVDTSSSTTGGGGSAAGSAVPGAGTLVGAGGVAAGTAAASALTSAGAAAATGVAQAPARASWTLPVGLGAAALAAVGLAAAAAFVPGLLFTPATGMGESVVAAPASPSTEAPTRRDSAPTEKPPAEDPDSEPEPREVEVEVEAEVEPGPAAPVSDAAPRQSTDEPAPQPEPAPVPMPAPVPVPVPEVSSDPEPAPAPDPEPSPSPEPEPSPEPGPSPEPEPTPEPEPDPDPMPSPPATVWSADPSGWLLPTVAGFADPGARVRVLSGGSAVAETTSAADGSWSIGPVALTPGEHSLSLVQVAPDGRVSAPSPTVEVRVMTPEFEARLLNRGRGEITVTAPTALRVVSVDGSCRTVSTGTPVGDGSFAQTVLVCTGLPGADADVRLRVESDPEGSGGIGPDFLVRFDEAEVDGDSTGGGFWFPWSRTAAAEAG